MRESNRPKLAAFAVSTFAALGYACVNTGGETAVDDPCPSDPNGATAFSNREDIRALPTPLKQRLLDLQARPSTYPPMTAFSEADTPSQLFQYYLIDNLEFQPNVFTINVPGITDGTKPTSAGANGNQAPVGSVRVALEPKPGKPTDPNDVRAVIDVWTDVSGLFVINNESGWYEGWMIRDVPVPAVAPAQQDGRAQYGTITEADAAAIAALGSGNNVTGNIFTMDGNAPRQGSAKDDFPDPARTPNTVAFPVSLGTFNALQQSDIHAYWEFNPGTNWVFPHYELPFTGGVPGTFEKGMIGALLSLVPGSGPLGTGPKLDGTTLDPVAYGDNPFNPRDPDRAEVSDPNDENRPEAPNPSHLEKRNRFIPSGLTEELLLSAFVRVASFEPTIKDPGMRLFMAYAKEVARVDQDGDGVISFVEADIEGSSDGLPNTRLYIPATGFNRYAMTRELNDGLLAPRFAPSQRAYVLSGKLTLVDPAVSASVKRDADDR